MSITDQIRVLQASLGDSAKLALASVDLAYPELSEPERRVLKDALEGAAIPHWCDEPILAAMNDITLEESTARLDRLRALRVVEGFPARGTTALNVHETTRLALRKRLAEAEPERFRSLSARTAEFFSNDLTAAGRIEWVFHLLTSDPERGADELETLNRHWSSSAPPEDLYALAAALNELEGAGLVHGRARVWVLLVVAWTRVGRGESAQLKEIAGDVLRLAEGAADLRAVSDAKCLFGDVMVAQGQLEAAQKAFGEYLAISRRLAEQDPSNAGWQRELAVAHSRVGGVLEAQGQLEAAQEAFGEDLAISRRLAEQDPSNAGWQRDLAVTCWRIASLREEAGRAEAALALYEEASRIYGELAAHAPGYAQWVSDKEAVESDLVRCRVLIQEAASGGEPPQGST